MGFLYLWGVVSFTLIPVMLSMRIMDGGLSLNCSQKEVQCKPEINNCMYDGWLKPSDFTPSGPDDLTVRIDVGSNMMGELEPVIVAEWKAKDDGSISFLKGTELAVMMLSTNERLCVHYMFLQNFDSMRNSDYQKWSFSLDKVVVDPDSTYLVTVSNLPKPNLNHTSYNINKKVVVPDCDDPLMRPTKICFERGTTWQPNVTVVKSESLNEKPGLLVTFTPGENAEKYNVFVKCNNYPQAFIKNTLFKERKTLLNVTYDLDNWSKTCCSFDVEIQPFFPKCASDCRRKNINVNICPESPPTTTTTNSMLWGICVAFCLLICGICVCFIYLRCRKSLKGPEKPPNPPPPEVPVPPGPRSVLIIYSRDHPLYTDIVLKLCAFLRAKCGVEVALDLLDTTWLGTIGRLQWIEQQKRRIEQASGKILVLCSRGMQAKWGAICGGPRVFLREDARSPMGDMLTLALQLITPDLQYPASYGKYLVAYFDDISNDRDVPSMFDIAVKYKLMKHFEELYFHVLDMEKYQQGMMHCIKGISNDDYFKCPSGKALRDAIETFQAYQIENPDWFESECINSEEDVRGESSPLLDIQTRVQPIYELKPVCNGGLPILVNEVEIHQETHSVCAVIPHIHETPSVRMINPMIHPEYSQVVSHYPQVEPSFEVPVVGMIPVGHESYPYLLAEPVAGEPSHPPSETSWSELISMQEQPDSCQTESSEGQNQASFAPPSEQAVQQLVDLFNVFWTPCEVTAPPPSLEDSLQLNQEMDISQPVEVEENEMDRASQTRPSGGSDQGYSSR